MKKQLSIIILILGSLPLLICQNNKELKHILIIQNPNGQPFFSEAHNYYTQNNQLFSIIFNPFLGTNDYNNFFQTPSFDNSKVFKNKRLFNRQFSLSIATNISPKMQWLSANRATSWFQAKVFFEQRNWELTPDYQYFIGKENMYFITNPEEDLQPISQGKGISLNRKTVGLALEFKTLTRGLWSYNIGLGMAMEFSNLKAAKNINYTPWATQLKFDKPFKNKMIPNAFGSLGVTFGSKIFISSELRFYTQNIKPSKNYQLYYETANQEPQKVSLTPKAKLAYSFSIGLGVRW